MTDAADRPAKEYGCALAVICFLVGVMVGTWWSGRGVDDRLESMERSQERIRVRLYEIEKKIEETVDESLAGREETKL